MILAAALWMSGPAHAQCTVDDVTASITRARWVNTCTTRECWHMRGTAVLEQRCAEAAVITVRLTGYDTRGTPIVTNEIVPFGVRAVRPGTHPFTLDDLLDHDPDAQAFGIEVVDVRKPFE